jgi:tRNA(fMet)-specific endonuclease VapC
MAGKLLLDTSLIVDLLRQSPAAIQIITSAEAVYVSTVALGEAFYGAEGSSQRELGLKQVEGLAASANVLPVDVEPRGIMAPSALI